jgi:hypothetical protein
MPDEGLEGAAEGVRAGVEAELDGVGGEPFLKGVRGIGAGAFIEEARHHVGDARLGGRVVRGAALEGEGKGDERHDLRFHVPGLDAAGRRDGTDLRRGGGAGLDGSKRHQGSRGVGGRRLKRRARCAGSRSPSAARRGSARPQR